jgi:CDP-diacylglycerol pyrophosphatase
MFARLACLGILLAGFLPTTSHADPSALWKIVSQQCVPHEQASRDPSPCTSVNLSQGVDKGFVVLKDINGASQFLLIPTARIGGIEDGVILTPDATNYWDAAWQARYYVESRLHTNQA